MTASGPLTLGTAGHIDHGKTALVRALTGVDTDRLPEERERGISIALGYAPMDLPSGRRLSLVDVPGHERFVRTMVAGASGIDLYLMVVAADDGVMPQTVEHAAVLRALDVTAGVVAITKADLADPGRAEREARALLPDAGAVVPCSAATGAGVAAVAAALDGVAACVSTRADLADEPLLHIDRSFTVDGIGTVVTGTLWSGTLHVGDVLTLLPGGRAVRVRGLRHTRPATVAGTRRAARGRQPRGCPRQGGWARRCAGGRRSCCPRPRSWTARWYWPAVRVTVNASRFTTARATYRDGSLTSATVCGSCGWSTPVLAADGDRVVVRRLSPPDTLGGGRVLDAIARRHGRRPEVMARLQARAQGQPEPAPEEVPPPVAAITPALPDPAAVLRVEADLRDAGLALLNAGSLDPADSRALAALRVNGSAVRISGQLYAHADVAADVQSRIIALIETTSSVSLPEIRDALGTGRKSAQAFLEYLDAQRVTRRQSDDRRILRGHAGAGSAP